jgi:acetyl esterase/lipase
MRKKPSNAACFNMAILFCFSGILLAAFSLEAGNFRKYKNITYTEGDPKAASRHMLDVYAPKDRAAKKEVFIFIHGGRWDSGKKGWYKYIGKRMAHKNVVAVIINYRLSPQAMYKGMVMDCAEAVLWVVENIEKYGGDSSRIFISGHSAGGHLAAFLAYDVACWDSLKVHNPLKGCILIDAFGLDMYTYFKSNKSKSDSTFLNTFSRSPKVWKEASPLYHVHSPALPCMIFYGERTYPAIKSGSADFYKVLKEHHAEASIEMVKKKKHIGMVLQLFCARNKLYHKMLVFMKHDFSL